MWDKKEEIKNPAVVRNQTRTPDDIYKANLECLARFSAFFFLSLTCVSLTTLVVTVALLSDAGLKLLAGGPRVHYTEK